MVINGGVLESVEKSDIVDGVFVVPSKVGYIKPGALAKCDNLKELHIKGSLMKFNLSALGKNSNIEKIYFNPKTHIPLSWGYQDRLRFLSKHGKEFCIASSPQTEDACQVQPSADLAWYFTAWEQRKRLEEDLKNPRNISLYREMKSFLTEEEFAEFLQTANLKYFNTIQVDERYGLHFQYLIRFMQTLGGFMPEQEFAVRNSAGIVKNQKINYSQKVTEFVKDCLDSGILTLEKIYEISKDMPYDGFKKDWTDFVLNKENLLSLLKEQNNTLGKTFFSRCYVEFEKIQKTNTSNKGKQRQRKPTIDVIVKYFTRGIFKGVTDETLPLAKAILRFFSSQKTFENAVEIMREKKEKNIPDRILSKQLKEENVFSKIDDMINYARKESADAVNILIDLAQRRYTYEILDKNDERNFILGKTCSCCAHLEGTGFGGMRASIVHPDMQNMVINDSSGQEIGKATVYVNRRKGYALFNTLCVSENITLNNPDDCEYVYQAFMRGAKAFVEEYNKENDRKITISTIGSSNNSLADIFSKYNEKSKIRYRGINLSEYQTEEFDIYEGDWDSNQYIVWRAEDENSRV